jgi:hypothetical protein
VKGVQGLHHRQSSWWDNHSWRNSSSLLRGLGFGLQQQVCPRHNPATYLEVTLVGGEEALKLSLRTWDARPDLLL